MSESASQTRAERIHQIASDNPSDAMHHLEEIHELLIDADPEARYHAMEALVIVSGSNPLALRDMIPRILSRLDDESTPVRGGSLTVVYNLSTWFPQDFVTATDLLVTSLTADRIEERVMAAGALSKIAIYRPHIITPRREAVAGLREIRADTGVIEQLEEMVIDVELLDRGIEVLSGGDMASRPVESDLATTPQTTSLSKPARVAFQSVFWTVAFVTWSLVAFINALRFAYRYDYKSPMGRLVILMGQTKKLKFLANRQRAVLYLRSSMWPTPVQIFRFLPGQAPTSADRSVRTGELPSDWGTVASLVRQRDGFYCRNCGVGGGPNGDAELHVDHQMPRSRDGANHPANLRTLCRACHEARHARIFDQ